MNFKFVIFSIASFLLSTVCSRTVTTMHEVDLVYVCGRSVNVVSCLSTVQQQGRTATAKVCRYGQQFYMCVVVVSDAVSKSCDRALEALLIHRGLLFSVGLWLAVVLWSS